MMMPSCRGSLQNSLVTTKYSRTTVSKTSGKRLKNPRKRVVCLCFLSLTTIAHLPFSSRSTGATRPLRSRCLLTGNKPGRRTLARLTDYELGTISPSEPKSGRLFLCNRLRTQVEGVKYCISGAGAGRWGERGGAPLGGRQSGLTRSGASSRPAAV
ncbi:hypothetical protein F5X96DRAFT_627576 [Biscogniauxia mediterranea]|nr:hypothetical protein F5X96DRAFT_627576 [Biscogniauxia mediterranea]